jgi:hypothetical protein
MSKSLSTLTILGVVSSFGMVIFFWLVAFVPAIGSVFLNDTSTKLMIIAIYATPVIIAAKAQKIEELLINLPETGVGVKFQTWSIKQKLKAELSDFLDMVAMCLESGLSMPAAVQKVRESSGSFPTLARELDVVLLEQSSFVSSVPGALKTIGSQYGVPEFLSVASTIEATARAGASVAQQLRNQSEALRQRLSAERQGRATSIGTVGLLIGLVLFGLSCLLSAIFPH